MTTLFKAVALLGIMSIFALAPSNITYEGEDTGRAPKDDNQRIKDDFKENLSFN